MEKRTANRVFQWASITMLIFTNRRLARAWLLSCANVGDRLYYPPKKLNKTKQKKPTTKKASIRVPLRFVVEMAQKPVKLPTDIESQLPIAIQTLMLIKTAAAKPVTVYQMN